MRFQNLISNGLTGILTGMMILFLMSSVVLGAGMEKIGMETAKAESIPGEPMSAMAFSDMELILTFSMAIIMILGLIFFFRIIEGNDLLEYRIVKWLMKSKLYPAILQIPTVIFFGFIVYYLFFGSSSYDKNPASILAWTLWWPLVPLTFILFGRLWCAICPFPIIGDFLQKFVHPKRKPGAFLSKYGIWITDGIFIAITLFDRLYGMVDNPLLSGAVFLLILFGVVCTSLYYERRTFCKYICFLGGVSGNYSMLSGLSIESKNKEVCVKCKAKACYFGSGHVSGCPYSNVIPSKVGMRNCTLCADCIKNCPHDNVAVRIRGIASELWSHTKVSFSESFFAKLMVGVVIVQNFGMLAVWANLIKWLMQFGIGEKISIIIIYFTAIAVPLILMSITSTISSRLQTIRTSAVDNFAAFGYAFIPIDVAGHIAHNLFHLLDEGKSILGALMGLFDGNVMMEGALTSPSVIEGLQFALIAMGGIGTLYVAYKIAKAREGGTLSAIKILLPHMALLLFIIIVNFLLFVMPMAHRGV